ncbi:MAG: NAD(P)-dependent alcohol dehydrogenase [Candidatus Obscuribacterales bacterium]
MTVLTKTRAYRLTEFDYNKISPADVDLPPLGPTDVLVEIKAASLNYRDFLIAGGLYNPSFKLPLVPLSDGSGQVVETGSRVTEFKPGDRVAGIFMQNWAAGPIDGSCGKSALGGEIDGVLQNHRVFPETGLVRLPEGYSFEEGAALPCAAVTAWNALFESGSLKPGKSVLVMGTGGVSVFALQFARAAGARIFATSSKDDRLELLESLGAHHTINYMSNPDWDKEILDATDGAGVDHIVEVGGAGTLPRSINCVATGGEISVIGVLAGMGKVDPIRVLMKAIRLQGIFVGSREMFENMNRALETNGIKPVIDKKVFGADEASAGIDYMKNGSHTGKIVLRF